MKNNLIQIEKELSDLIEVDKKNWTHFYVLLKEVEEEALWKEKYKSFTQWVKDFCIKTKTHESIIWNRKKAGKVYESYIETQKARGVTVPPITESNVSADSLVILDKINKYDQEIASDLVKKVIDKEITKKDLREVYKSIRPNKISNNPHIKTIEITEEKREKIKITAADIVSTLYGIEWLSKKKIDRKYFRTAFEQNKYRTFTEFPVYTGSSRKSRRMDMLISENITTENVWDLNLHCIEIKVSKSDLTRDMKYTEYAPFVDYLWLAVPSELVSIALETKFSSCGIIEVTNDKKAKIVEAAAPLDADRKMETMKNMILKLM